MNIIKAKVDPKKKPSKKVKSARYVATKDAIKSLMLDEIAKGEAGDISLITQYVDELKEMENDEAGIINSENEDIMDAPEMNRQSMDMDSLEGNDGSLDELEDDLDEERAYENGVEDMGENELQVASKRKKAFKRIKTAKKVKKANAEITAEDPAKKEEGATKRIQSFKVVKV